MREPSFPVSVSSFGCASACGLNLQETHAALSGGFSGVAPVDLFSVQGCRSQSAARFPAALPSRAAEIHAPAKRWSRAAQAVLVALEEALRGTPSRSFDQVIVGTTSGGMDLGEAFYRRAILGGSLSSASRRVRGYLPTEPVQEALRVFKIEAPIRIVSNACASGTNALGMAWQMVTSGRARRVLAGGYDILSQLVFAGFDCLQASTPEMCRPFDAGRSGLVLGEGAAFFILERDGPIRVAGYGAATDTHHLTQPHPSGIGPATAMRRALLAADLDAGAIQHINAHGTATPQNDACEAQAILDVCPQAAVTSTKAMTGHTLGAAGAIEAAFCLISLNAQFLPPTLNFRGFDEGVSMDLVANHARKSQVSTVMSNSFGFGGANASIIFHRP